MLIAVHAMVSVLSYALFSTSMTFSLLKITDVHAMMASNEGSNELTYIIIILFLVHYELPFSNINTQREKSDFRHSKNQFNVFSALKQEKIIVV